MKKTILLVLCLALFSIAYASGQDVYALPVDDAGAEVDAAEDGDGAGGMVGRKGMGGDGSDKLGSLMTGGRSRSSIQRVVTANMSDLSRTYNALLRVMPERGGTVTVRFAVNEHGKVIHSRVAHSTIKVPEFENIVATLVRTWDFGPNHKPGDVTEVTYPFVFTP